jgi:hypothetical protein
MNACAAAYIAYGEMVGAGVSRIGLGPKTRQMPVWLPRAVGLFFAIGLAVMLLGGGLPHAGIVGYLSLAIGAALLALQSGADAANFSDPHADGNGFGAHAAVEKRPSLDDHIPSIGLGKPMNRTVWAITWASIAVVFQAMGVVYALGNHVVMPGFIRDGVDALMGPTSFFVMTTAGFLAMYAWRRTWSSGVVAWAIVNVLLLAFGLSLTDYDFRSIVVKPDNVPIVGMIVLVGYFTWIAMRRAVINDARMARGLPNLEEMEPEKVLTWPDLVYTELIAMVVCTIVLVVWSIALKAPLEGPASATQAPNPSKAPWYFLGLQEMLVYFDPWIAGVFLPTLIIVGLMALPYIDNNKQGNGYYTIDQRKFAYVSFQYGFLILWVVLILLGTFLRGPNWNFFGPYEYWDVHKLIPLNNVNLSDIVWVQVLGSPKPQEIVMREFPGILVVLGYLVVVPVVLGKTVFKKYIAEAGMVRYMVLAFLILMMASLPIKMVLRWTMNLKYLIAIPEWFFNI